jgi:hypothetical protein
MPRRGLIAVGLAVTIAAGLGVAGIMTAQADEVPDAPAAAPAKRVYNPPPLLPWGEPATPGQVGAAGTSSDTLRARGFDAAPAAAGRGSYRPHYAPKGRTGRTTFLKSENTTTQLPGVKAAVTTDEGPADGAAPAPSAPAPTAPTNGSKAQYYYNYGRMPAVSDGFYTTVSIAKPTLAKYDYHTLAELAVQSADGHQIVEVGWNVDRVVNGDEQPHLFVYHWVNLEESCYNGCGYEPYPDATVKVGDVLPTGAKKFGILFFEGAWWISYDSNWVGFFPEELWTSKGVDSFSKTGLVQTFGEVASTLDTPCSQMGNGAWGSDAKSTVLGSFSFVNGPTPDLEIKTTTPYYQVNPLSSRTLQYGGPGGIKVPGGTKEKVCAS